MSTAIMIASVAGLALAAYWLAARSRTAWQSTEPLPAELYGARLWASEKPLRCRWPVNLCGRIDQAWRTRDRRIVAVETKYRLKPTIYPADRLQLSLYAFLLRRRPWAWLSRTRIASHGYVRVVTPAGVTYMQVQLLTDHEAVAACDRYLDLTCRRTAPRAAASPALCRACAYASDCPQRNRFEKASRVPA